MPQLKGGGTTGKSPEFYEEMAHNAIATPSQARRMLREIAKGLLEEGSPARAQAILRSLEVLTGDNLPKPPKPMRHRQKPRELEE